MTVRWGIIGCGNVADFKGGPALYNVPNSELVVVMRRDKAKAREFARRHGAKRHYSTVDDVLGDDDVNAVYIATPPNSHAELTRRAAAAGKHVLCEKPMAMSVAEAQSMIDACRDAGVQLMIAYYRRYWPVALKIREVLASGAIGTPVFARAQNQALYHAPEDGSTPWRVDPRIAGGGYLMDIGSHRIDLLVGLLGDVEEVRAFVDTMTFDIAVDDSSALLMRFAGGVRAVGLFNWNVGAYCDEFEIGGTAGRIIATDLGKGELTVVTSDGEQLFHLPPPKITHLGLVADFVESIEAGRPNGLSGEQGLKTTAIMEAAYRSAQSGRAVPLD